MYMLSLYDTFLELFVVEENIWNIQLFFLSIND